MGGNGSSSSDLFSQLFEIESCPLGISDIVLMILGRVVKVAICKLILISKLSALPCSITFTGLNEVVLALGAKQYNNIAGRGSSEGGWPLVRFFFRFYV